MPSLSQALQARRLSRLTRSPFLLGALVVAMSLLCFFAFTVQVGVDRGTALRESQRQEDLARVERASANTPNRRVQAAEQEADANRWHRP